MPILIAGAGPAGLALAQQLRKRGVPFRIFDRDHSLDTRGQGWAVALQWIIPELRDSVPTDLAPIETISHLHNQNLLSELAAYVNDGTEIYRREQCDEFLRADRLKLRAWLATSIDVEWNKKVVGFVEGEHDVEAEFEDGSKVKGCALISGEGGHSRIRAQLLSDHELHDPPFDSVLGNLVLSREEYEQVFQSLARSVIVIQRDDVFLFIGLHEVEDDGKSSAWYWMAVHPRQGDVSATDRQSAKAIHEQAVKWVEPLPEKFKSFVLRTKPDECITMTSFIQTWSPPDEGFSTNRVTMIGDSAHKTTPLGGVGVNHAIQDTFDLVRFLDSNDTIPAAFKEYDAVVTKRGQEAIKKCTTWPFLTADW